MGNDNVVCQAKLMMKHRKGSSKARGKRHGSNDWKTAGRRHVTLCCADDFSIIVFYMNQRELHLINEGHV